MKISPLFAVVALALAPVAAQAADTVAPVAVPAASVTPGKMLYAAGGKRLAAVYRVAADGSPQIILDGKLVTVPVSTLAMDGDKATTSLTKAQLAR